MDPIRKHSTEKDTVDPVPLENPAFPNWFKCTLRASPWPGFIVLKPETSSQQQEMDQCHLPGQPLLSPLPLHIMTNVLFPLPVSCAVNLGSAASTSALVMKKRLQS